MIGGLCIPFSLYRTLALHDHGNDSCPCHDIDADRRHKRPEIRDAASKVIRLWKMIDDGSCSHHVEPLRSMDEHRRHDLLRDFAESLVRYEQVRDHVTIIARDGGKADDDAASSGERDPDIMPRARFWASDCMTPATALFACTGSGKCPNLQLLEHLVRVPDIRLDVQDERGDTALNRAMVGRDEGWRAAALLWDAGARRIQGTPLLHRVQEREDLLWRDKHAYPFIFEAAMREEQSRRTSGSSVRSGIARTGSRAQGVDGGGVAATGPGLMLNPDTHRKREMARASQYWATEFARASAPADHHARGLPENSDSRHTYCDACDVAINTLLDPTVNMPLDVSKRKQLIAYIEHKRSTETERHRGFLSRRGMMSGNPLDTIDSVGPDPIANYPRFFPKQRHAAHRVYTDHNLLGG